MWVRVRDALPRSRYLERSLAMRLVSLDWMVMALYGVVVLFTGLAFARRASRDTTEYFLGGRRIPWWVLGTSMVATTSRPTHRTS
jgi:hypothetical protein